jgi:uncharacterized protein (TIGR02118 family)
MIKVTFLYANTPGSRFDLDYYLTQHLDLSRAVFGDVLRGLEIDHGTSGIEPGSASPYHAVAHMKFDSAEDFYAALMPRLDDLRADVPNYTDTETIIQISESIELSV